MTNKEVIEDLKKSNEQLKARLKVEMMRMETAEIKETKYYIERNNLCIQALEQEQVKTQMSSADCISRQTQLENGDRAVSLNAVKGILKMANMEEFDILAYRNIMQLPPVKPQEKIGHWILLDECSNSGYYCSECQKKVVKEGWSNTVKKIKYCPNCGAMMIEPQERSE